MLYIAFKNINKNILGNVIHTHEKRCGFLLKVKSQLISVDTKLIITHA